MVLPSLIHGTGTLSPQCMTLQINCPLCVALSLVVFTYIQYSWRLSKAFTTDIETFFFVFSLSLNCTICRKSLCTMVNIQQVFFLIQGM